MAYTADNYYKDELKRLEEKKANADSILSSQDRLSKLNEGYRKRYAKYVEIIMMLVLLYAIYLGMQMLQKKIPAIPQIAVDVVTMLLIFYLGYYLFNAFWELSTRSLINYDELEMAPYDSSGVNVADLEANSKILSKGASHDICVGEECCPGYFNKETQLCGTVPISSNTVAASATISGFTSLEQYTLERDRYELPFNSSRLKREYTMNVKPMGEIFSLSYSKV